MIPSDFARAVLKVLDESIASYSLSIAEGSFHKIEDYQRACGERHGMLAARRMIVDQLSKTAPMEAREFTG